MASIRPMAVAGLFYPNDQKVLRQEVQALLSEVKKVPPPTGNLKALIVPHAGIIYSGLTAAYGYHLLQEKKSAPQRIVLLGPSHHAWIEGLALSHYQSFASPLGVIPIDQAAIKKLEGFSQVFHSEEAHSQEHSLEVQLPFLQMMLEKFSLIPFAVGEASSSAIAEILNNLWGGPETMILISSDLSHYLSYQAAKIKDAATIRNILDLEFLNEDNQACGAVPINGLIEIAKQRHLKPELIDYRNSGDTAGDKFRVVGYSSIAFYE